MFKIFKNKSQLHSSRFGLRVKERKKERKKECCSSKTLMDVGSKSCSKFLQNFSDQRQKILFNFLDFVNV